MGKSLTIPVPYRGFILALLASYLHFFVLVLFALMVVANFISALFVIDTKWSKHFMTAFAAVLLPTCFVSREHIEDAGYGRRLFNRFYKVNAFVFFFLATAGLVAANCLLHYTDQLEFNCNNLPFLSYDSANNCPAKSALGGLSPPFEEVLTRSTRGFTPSAAASCSRSPSSMLSSSL